MNIIDGQFDKEFGKPYLNGMIDTAFSKQTGYKQNHQNSIGSGHNAPGDTFYKTPVVRFGFVLSQNLRSIGYEEVRIQQIFFVIP